MKNNNIFGSTAGTGWFSMES